MTAQDCRSHPALRLTLPPLSTTRHSAMISSDKRSSGIRKHWTSKKELDYRPKSMTVDKKIKGNVQIALLRGVMPIGRNRVPMADLRELLMDLGFDGVRTYIASGNAVFRSEELAGAKLEALLEREIAKRIGPSLDVMVRNASAWDRLIAANPFPDDAAERPNKLLVTVLKNTPNKDGIRAFEALVESPDKCRVMDDVAWIVFTAASSLSKLTPAAYRRTLGVSGTGRNWNTVLKLRDLAAQVGAEGNP